MTVVDTTQSNAAVSASNAQTATTTASTSSATKNVVDLYESASSEGCETI